MDPYTIGILLKSLLASAGLKATIAIVIVGGSLMGVYKAAKAMAGFFQQLLASRDAMLSDTMRRIAQQDVERAQFQVQVMTIMERINGHQEKTMIEAGDTRKEMHMRFNKIQEDVTTIKGAVA